MPEPVGPNTPPELAEAAYAKFPASVAVARERLGRPLTFGEKILFAHAEDPRSVGLTRGVDYGDYRPDRVAMQDALAQVVLLQFMLAGLATTAVPTTVHCDHLIQARVGADADLAAALDVNHEVYEFLRGMREVRHRLLEARKRDHPPSRAGELRVSRRHDDRHRLAHTQRGRARDDRHRCRRRRRRRRDVGLALQPAFRRTSACGSSEPCRAGPRPRTSS